MVDSAQRARGAVRFSRADCALFAPRAARARWADLTAGEQSRLRGLHARLRTLVTDAAKRYGARVEIVPWVSSLNPNGAAPREMGACVHPASAPNRAFALQVALILGAAGAELCFCVGAGTAQIKDRAQLRRGRWFLQSSRERLAELPASLVDALDRTLGASWSYRRRWKEAPDARDFATLGAWLEHAASSDGAGAAVSVNLSPEALEALGPAVGDYFVASAALFRPLFEHVYGPASLAANESDPATPVTPEETDVARVHEPSRAVATLIDAVESSGYVFEPWQLAAYVAALRTKPFVILAGTTGTGKSRLPALVAEATGGESVLLPVRPDWTDSSEVLGYSDLQGGFRPGPLLRLARRANDWPNTQFVCIVDEMNVARVEHYFAEVLSRIEERREDAGGRVRSGPLLGTTLRADDAPWGALELPANLALVGTVNMDESAHGFSRKVLDRAFTIELSEVDLARWDPASRVQLPVEPWPSHAWRPRALRLGSLGELDNGERATVERAVNSLAEANTVLAPAQLQVGYRTRDEVALFALHARELGDRAFRTRAGEPVDPLDLALQMKVLPRIAGGIAPVRRVVLGLLGWALTGKPFARDTDARGALDAWDARGRPTAVPGARFPRTAAKLCLMWDRLASEGFASFWT